MGKYGQINYEWAVFNSYVELPEDKRAYISTEKLR